MVSTRLLISKSFNTCTNPLFTVPTAPISIKISITFMFHNSFSISPDTYHDFHISSPDTYPDLNFLTSLFCGHQRQKSPQFWKFSCSLLIIIRSVCLAEISWYVCISKSQRSLCVFFSRKTSMLCQYHLFIWLNFNFLQNSQFLSQSFLINFLC